ncbi:MAG: histidine--tRNA ligase [Promethearchaeota archaeon]
MENNNSSKDKINLQRPSGTVDYLPEEMALRRWVESKLVELFEKYGYQQIELPMYEFFDIYKKRSGEKIINDIFTFYDPPKHRAEENPPLYALRPEFTASLVRFFITSELMYRPKPQKYYYIGPCFRYDEPAPGRFRQFTQAGIEIFGSDKVGADAEMLLVAMDIMRTFKIEDYILRINDLTVLRTFLNEREVSHSTQKNIFGIIDRITSLLRKLEIGALEEEQNRDTILEDYRGSIAEENISAELSQRLELLLDMVGPADKVINQLNNAFSDYPNTLKAIEDSKISHITPFLQAAGIENFVVDCGIARGLDYYTNLVFEIDVPILGKQKQICGGGRYNEMIRVFGGEDTPALGFSFGFDRILLALEKQNKLPSIKPRSQVFIGTKLETQTFGIQIAQKLRENGISTEVDLMSRSFRAASKFVNRLEIPFMIFLGPRELKTQKFTLKNFITEKQERELNLEEVIQIIKKSAK